MYKEAPRYYTRGAMFVKKMKEIRSQILKQVKEEYEHRGLSANTVHHSLAKRRRKTIHQLRYFF